MNADLVRLLTSWVVDQGLTPGVIFMAQYLGWILAAAYIFVLIWRPKRSWQEEVIFVLTAALITWVLVQVIKMSYVSPRPFLFLSDYAPLLKFGANESFPSGHAAVMFAFGFSLSIYRKFFSNLVILSAVVISFSRVAAGLHWPTDILGGFVLAGVVVVTLAFVFNRIRLSQVA